MGRSYCPFPEAIATHPGQVGLLKDRRGKEQDYWGLVDFTARKSADASPISESADNSD